MAAYQSVKLVVGDISLYNLSLMEHVYIGILCYTGCKTS